MDDYACETVKALARTRHDLEVIKNESGDTVSWAYTEDKLERWLSRTWELLSTRINREEAERFRGKLDLAEWSSTPSTDFLLRYEICKTYIEVLREEIISHPDDFGIEAKEARAKPVSEAYVEYGELGLAEDPSELVLRIIDKFHLIAMHMRSRRAPSPPLTMDDEYDVQYLLGGLLRLFFNDVTAEELATGLAGGGTRLDFFINDYNGGLVLEAKKATASHSGADIRNELLADKELYKTHAGCKYIICFVYDPDGVIENPTRFEIDLTFTEEQPPMTTHVRPMRT